MYNAEVHVHKLSVNADNSSIEPTRPLTELTENECNLSTTLTVTQSSGWRPQQLQHLRNKMYTNSWHIWLHLLLSSVTCGVQLHQSKMRSLRTSGAIRVQQYRARHTQLDEIFTHIAGSLALNTLKSELGLHTKQATKMQTSKTHDHTRDTKFRRVPHRPRMNRKVWSKKIYKDWGLPGKRWRQWRSTNNSGITVWPNASTWAQFESGTRSKATRQQVEVA